MFEATLSSLGNYAECLAITVPTDNELTGQYCLPDLFPTRMKRERRLTLEDRRDRAMSGRINLGDIR